MSNEKTREEMERIKKAMGFDRLVKEYANKHGRTDVDDETVRKEIDEQLWRIFTTLRGQEPKS